MIAHKNVKRYNDQMHCSTCGKQWDVNDIDPPSCVSNHDLFLQQRKRLKKVNADERTKSNRNR